VKYVGKVWDVVVVVLVEQLVLLEWTLYGHRRRQKAGQRFFRYRWRGIHEVTVEGGGTKAKSATPTPPSCI
jgi:hypothetical protein